MIIVTGDTGFIGSYLVKEMIELDYQVVGISRSLIYNENRYRHISVDMEDFQKLYDNLENISIDGIIHLAANISVPGDYATASENILITENIVKLANMKDAKFLINISSIPVIGKPTLIPITENHPVNPLTPYHYSKKKSEEIIQQGLLEKIQYTNIRIASPVGVGMSRKVFIYRILESCLVSKKISIYGEGTRIQNYIDVRDIVDIILRSIRSEKSGLFLANGNSISNKELVFLCKKITNSKSIVEMVNTKDLQDEDRWIISEEKAKKELGFVRKYSIEDTIKWIYESMRKKYEDDNIL